MVQSLLSFITISFGSDRNGKAAMHMIVSYLLFIALAITYLVLFGQMITTDKRIVANVDKYETFGTCTDG